MVLHTRASEQRHREHLRLPSPVQAVAGHAASAQCTALHVKKKAKVRPKEDTTSVFLSLFEQEQANWTPIGCWNLCRFGLLVGHVVCLIHEGVSGLRWESNAARMPTSKPKMSRRHYFSFFCLLAHETSCTFAIGFQSNSIAFGTLLIERC